MVFYHHSELRDYLLEYFSVKRMSKNSLLAREEIDNQICFGTIVSLFFVRHEGRKVQKEGDGIKGRKGMEMIEEEEEGLKRHLARLLYRT